MRDSVPTFYEHDASFCAWAHETSLESPPTIRARLKEQREALLEEIDWQGPWDRRQSQRLALLDDLLKI